MQSRDWNWTYGVRIAAWSVLFVLVLFPILEFALPGSVMCPLRRLGKQLELPVGELSWDMLADMDPMEIDQAREASADWKQEAINAYPNLKVDAHPVPLEENGYWQLIQLEFSPHQPTANFSEMIRELKTYDIEGVHLEMIEPRRVIDIQNARRELDASAAWIQHIEWIAGLNHASSIELPNRPHWLPSDHCQQAHDAMLVKSLVAAEDQNEAESLRWLTMAGNFADHLRKIETPTLADESFAMLLHQQRLECANDQIMGRLRTQIHTDRWQHEFARFDTSHSRLTRAIRGEWHANSTSMVHPFLVISHRQRMLVDPKAVAMANAAIVSQSIQQLENAPSIKSLSDLWSDPPWPEHLSPEGREIWRDTCIINRELLADWASSLDRIKDRHGAATEHLNVIRYLHMIRSQPR